MITLQCGDCGTTYPNGGWHSCAPAKAVGYVSVEAADPVNHPPHYVGHPSGIECIVITEHLNFCRGNAIKYIWRAGEKGDELEDLKKASWYVTREISRLEKLAKNRG